VAEPNIEEGLHWLNIAAESGVVEAQAISYRLHCALKTSNVADPRTAEWLLSAAKAGSVIAFEDLRHVDPVLYVLAIKHKKRVPLFSRDDIRESRTRDRDSYLSRADFLRILQTDEESIALQLPNLVSLFQTKGLTINDPMPTTVYPLLHIAASVGDPAWADVLLRLGADINGKSEDRGQRPLFCACETSNITMVKHLLDRGVDLTLSNDAGATFIHHVALLPDEVAADLIRRYATPKMDLNKKAKGILLGMFLFEDYTYQGTPLHWAVRLKRERLVIALLELGADPLAPDVDWSYARELEWNLLGAIPEDNAISDSTLGLAVRDHQPDITDCIIKHLAASGRKIDFPSLIAVALRSVKLRMMLVFEVMRWCRC
jgi:hypothetical protein